MSAGRIPHRVKMKERAIKRALLEQLKKTDIDIDEIVEWLWEDFGKKVRRNWQSVESAVLGDSDITPQDLAVFMIDQDILPDEGAWSVEPTSGLPGRKGRIKGG